MTLVKFQPNRNVVPFSRAISSMFDDFFTNSPLANLDLPVVNIRPSVDIIEEEDKVTLKADMPGLEKNDIKVVVNDGLLTIEGSRNETREEKGKGFTRTERFMGTFSRSFNLPVWADGSKVLADYKNGVLTVTIPKTEQARPKEIEVKVG
jgi:HSP20 family protein